MRKISYYYYYRLRNVDSGSNRSVRGEDDGASLGDVSCATGGHRAKPDVKPEAHNVEEDAV